MQITNHTQSTQVFATLRKKRSTRRLPYRPGLQPPFTIRYPFDQCVCFAPDGDFYATIRSGRANVGTGTIEKIADGGIFLKSGAKIDADIIITAIGLKLQLGGRINLGLGGKSYSINDNFLWQNAMLQDLPNIVFMMGYTTAPWTLGADPADYAMSTAKRDAQTEFDELGPTDVRRRVRLC